jgi:hypothetical protein
MAQDIIIRTLCDVCLDSGEERHDASAYTIGDGPVLLDIDLCDVHAKPLAELVAHARPSERGKPPKRKRAPAGPVAPVIESAGAHACEDAGCGRVFASAHGRRGRRGGRVPCSLSADGCRNGRANDLFHTSSVGPAVCCV